MDYRTKTREELATELQEVHKELDSLKVSKGQNITGSLPEEEPLTVSKEIFRSIFENNSAAMAFIEPDTTISMVNDEYCNLSGYTKEEVIGISWTQQIPPQDLERLKEYNRRRLINPKDAPDKYEFTFCRKNGEIRHSMMSVTMLSNQKIIASFVDITERKEAEEKFVKSEAQLANALDIAKLGPWEYNVATDTFTFNDHFYNVFRTTVEREGGYTMTSAQYTRRFVDPDDMLQVGDETRKAIETTDPNFSRDIEHRIIYADGETGYINVHFFILKDAQGNTVKTYGVIQDITERKKAQESLKDSEQRYRNLFDQANEGLILLSKDGKLVEVNQAFAEMHGYTVEEMKNLDIRELDVLREGAFEARAELMQRIDAGEVARFEVEHYHKDGHIVTFSDSASLIEIGGQQYYLAFHQDITERKRMEASLKESEEKYRNLFENVQDVFYQIDLAGIIQDISPSIKHFSEFSRDEILGTNVADLYYNPDDRGAFLKAIYQQGEIRDYELFIKTKSGDKKVVSLNANLVFDADGKPNHIDGALRDITDRKLIEDKIREKEIQFRKLSSNLPDLIYQFSRRLDGTYCVPIASEGIKNIFGCSPEDVLEDFAPIGRVIFPEDAERVINDIEYSAKHLTYFTCEFRVQIPGKPIQWIFSRSTPEKLADGSITWYGFNADITELKQNEEEILELNRDLELRVKQRTSELEAANKELEAFSYSVSHDLKTPLRHIRSFIGLFLENKSKDLSEEDLRYLDIISSSASNMDKLIDAILSFSRLNGIELRNTRIRSSEIVQQVIKFFDPEIQNRKITLNVETLPEIKGDEDLIRQVWINLISNAIKYTMKKPEAIIEIGSSSTDKEITFYIKDNGAGFNVKYAEKLFGVFQRLHKPRDFEGIGIGLANVNRIITRHGGHCRAEGEVDKGATFYFSLPK